ncbi:thermonuclease family protein [Hyella patelloides]|uniref:thermonuclease family protein n=1 Tax=Hyella patelloides TaxID=1982969 RepID=UPI001643D2FB|nr:thermonuclease family protein [Hyella patelloides]
MLLSKIVSQAIVLIICLFLWSCSVTEREIDGRKCRRSVGIFHSRVDRNALSAQLVKVVSGQTIEVIIPQQDNQLQRVRIIGIDVPKLEDTLGREQGKTRLKELLTDNKINLELESDERDRYNRIFAHVWHHDTLVSEELAKEGYVLANTKYPHKYSDRIFHAQEYARILGYGIWK